MSPYKCFDELAGQEFEGQDYTIRIRTKTSPVLVMAPHGGKIEPGTGEITEAIAGDEYSFYCFEGIKAGGNGTLHIGSHLFDEPRALKALRAAEIVVTVHGHANRDDGFVMVGGLDNTLKTRIEGELTRAGFQIREATEGLKATDPANICNRGRSGKGVQLEISRKLRDSCRAHRDCLREFAGAVRRGIR